MNRSRITRQSLVGGLVCSTLLVLSSAAAFAAAPPSKPAAPGRPPARPAAPPERPTGQDPAGQGMDQKRMDAMEANGTPGPHHEWLAGYAGSWVIEVTHWMAPNAPPHRSQGMAVAEMGLGGLFLLEKVRGDFDGMPFEGQAISGYDNLRKEFVFSWIDNMSSGIMTGTGQLSEDRKTMTSKMTTMDPSTGKPVTVRNVEVFESPDRRRSESFMTGPDGKEFKTMELTYTRRSADPAGPAGRDGAGGRRGEPGGAGRGGAGGDGGRGGRGSGGGGGTGGSGGTGGTGGRGTGGGGGSGGR